MSGVHANEKLLARDAPGVMNALAQKIRAILLTVCTAFAKLHMHTASLLAEDRRVPHGSFIRQGDAFPFRTGVIER